MYCNSVKNITTNYKNFYTFNKNFKKSNQKYLISNPCGNISFKSYPVYLLDGDKHANNIKTFAQVHDKEMDVHLINIKTNSVEPSLKQMDSALIHLKDVRNLPKGSHVAFLCAMFVPILNINDRMDSVNEGTSRHLISNNVKKSKDDVLRLLKAFRDNPLKYADDIKHIDPLRQGVEYVYDIILEINKLTDEGYKIYIPASHPNHQSIKYLKKERNISNEFYHYMATGQDETNSVSDMLQYIHDNNWDEINLLEFSNAHVVNMTKNDGSPFVYSSHNDSLTDEAVGVYNFTPIRKDNEIIGFSYSDDTTPEVKIKDFTDYESVKELIPFVGKELKDVLATEDETQKYKNGDLTNVGKKLFKLEDVFSPYDISIKKLKLLGSYTDGKNIFDVNSNGKVIFQKLNCEGSEKPSIFAMWGNCYAVMAAIKNDAEKAGLRNENKKSENLLVKTKDNAFKKFNVRISENTIELPNVIQKLHDADEKEYQGDINEACEIYKNIAIAVLKNNILSVRQIKEACDKKNEYDRLYSKYKKDLEKYSKAGFISKIFMSVPVRPVKSFDGRLANQWSVIKDCANILKYTGELYTKSEKYIPDGRICYIAATRLLKGNVESDKLLSAIKSDEMWEEML